MLKLILATCTTAVSLVAAAGASAANSPVPVPGTASCQGHFMAISNHASGMYGASGNPTASAGPGYFMHSSTHDAVQEYVAEYCG